MKVTLVVPCYNEEKNVALFYEVAEAAFQNRKIEYDIRYITKDKNACDIAKEYSEEENVFETDVANLKANFPELAVAMMNRTPYRLELPLSSITKICPRNRQRIDSYDRLKRYLLTKGVELIVYSQKTKKI